MTTVVSRYLACWNETDPTARRELLAQYWTPEAIYIDPLSDVQGYEAIDATIAAVQAQFPGLVFTSAGDVDTHHNLSRFSWGLGPAGGEALVIGFDVVVTDADGRIDSVLGFLDRVPTEAAAA